MSQSLPEHTEGCYHTHGWLLPSLNQPANLEEPVQPAVFDVDIKSFINWSYTFGRTLAFSWENSHTSLFGQAVLPELSSYLLRQPTHPKCFFFCGVMAVPVGNRCGNWHVLS